MEETVLTGTTGGLAQQLRLDRAARTAGKPSRSSTRTSRAGEARLLPLGGIGLAFLLLAALVALSIGVLSRPAARRGRFRSANPPCGPPAFWR